MHAIVPPRVVLCSWPLRALASLLLSWLLATEVAAISTRTLIQTDEPTASLSGNVGAVGDLNGDGYSDFAVGANLFAGSDPGRVLVYFGGASPNAAPDLVFVGETNFDGFGTSITDAGDFNGDGHRDLLVGAPRNDVAGADAGRAYLFFGGPFMDTVADIIFTGAAASDAFGWSTARAGDINGDGYSDVVVGAYLNDQGAADAGRAYVYLGGPSPDAIADLTITSGQAGAQLGQAVSSAGDMNGDGYDDFAVGAPRYDDASTDYGLVQVFLGGPVPNTSPDLYLVGAQGDLLGTSVAPADVNGDGFDDLVVGAPSINASTGRAYVYFGSAALNTVVDLTYTGTSGLDQFGISVTGADLNSDGFDDVVVGAHRSNLTGRVYVFWGGIAPDLIVDVSLSPADGSRYGANLVSPGDLDGDGHADLVIGYGQMDRVHAVAFYPYQIVSPVAGEQWVAGQPATVRWRGHDPADLAVSLDGGLTWSTRAAGLGGNEDNAFTLTAPPAETRTAKVRLSYTGVAVSRSTSTESRSVFSIVPAVAPPRAAQRVQRTMDAQAAFDVFGAVVAPAGDMNGDGFPDVIVGAPFNSEGGPQTGRAYVYFGGPSADGIADVTFTGEFTGDMFGSTVSGAGDFNRDGYDDVIVGASSNGFANGPGSGRAYLFFGGPTPDAYADRVLNGAQAYDYFGASVAGAGDLNGDGVDDVIVGNADSGGDASRAFVYFGSAAADPVADLTLSSGVVGDNFGSTVRSARDLNADGFSDVVVCAQGSDAGGTDAGRAFVYLGAATMDATADLVLTGAAAGDAFGYSAAAGDFDSDGFGDVLIGAPGSDAGGAGSGRIYMYFGGPSMDTTPDREFTGNVGEAFGYSVGAAGDVNSDGHDDLVIGSPNHNAARGQVLVYFGGPGADVAADAVVDGEAEFDGLGAAVAGAGDANGDGFDDVIAGAPNHGVGALLNAGRAYLLDFNRYFLLAPNGGETWNVGATRTVSWLGPEPADVWLSVDAGRSYDRIRSSVGGRESNTLPLLVPHAPTHFARIRIAPADTQLPGSDESDAQFTIQSSIALLDFTVSPGDGGADLSWHTNPGVGPTGLAGYRLYREGMGGSGPETRIGPDLIREERFHDSVGQPGDRYRLVAVNGLMEELQLGHASLRPAVPLAASPVPYRSGRMTITFAVYGVLGARQGEARIELHDLSGRRVASIAQGVFEAGYQAVTWDGRDEQGHAVPNGMYFLRARTAGLDHRMKVIVAR